MLPFWSQPAVLRCGMGWLYLLPVLCIVAAVVIHTAWRRLIQFRCGRLQPAAELSERGGWSDWCEECARSCRQPVSADSVKLG